MKIKIVLLALLSLLTFGCSDWYKDDQNSKTAQELPDSTQPDDNLPSRNIETIFESLPIIDEIEVSHVQEGDVLYLTIKGIERKSRFTNVYQRMASSRWKVEKCMHSCSRCEPLNKDRVCFFIDKRGSCQLQYRDYLDEVEEVMSFGQNMEKVALKIKIGAHSYHLGNDYTNDQETLHVKFPIYKSMVEADGKLFLVVNQDAIQAVKVGFLGYAGCDGLGQVDFNVDASLSSTSVDSYNTKEFEITAKIWRQQ